MKHLELRKEFKNKYLIRVAAGAVTIAVLGTSVGMNTYLVQAERNAQETAATIENSDENTTGISNAENKNNENTNKTGGEKERGRRKRRDSIYCCRAKRKRQKCDSQRMAEE